MEMRNAVRATALLLALGVLAAPSFAAPESLALGVPDAPPPVERLIARQDAVQLPDGLQTPEGRRLPAGMYDLAVIECGGRYFLQITSRETRKGFRTILQPQVGTDVRALAPSGEANTSIHLANRSLLVTRGEHTMTFPLSGSHTTG